MSVVWLGNAIFGEGGYEHFEQAIAKGPGGQDVTFKAIQKSADECGWALDPEGIGIHCASTGRSKFMLWFSMLITFATLFILSNDLYNLYLGEQKDNESKNYNRLYASSTFLTVIFIYVIYLSVLSSKKDKWNYGTTDWFLGTYSQKNKRGKDIENGPYYEIVHNSDYFESVANQVKNIRDEIAKGVYKKDYKKLNIKQKRDISKQIKEQVGAEVMTIAEQKKAVQKGKIKVLPGGILEGTTVAKAHEAMKQDANKKLENKTMVDLRSFGTEIKPNLTQKELLKERKTKLETISGINKNNELAQFSKKGNCDICAGMTGKSTGEGRCSTSTRCTISAVMFGIFGLYFLGMGSYQAYMITNDPPPEKREDEIISEYGFLVALIGINFTMFVLCVLAVILMVWSAKYCPSGSDFARIGFMGIEYSFRW